MVDWQLILFSIFSFVFIGLFLGSLILFARSKLVQKVERKIFINNDDSLTKEVEGGGTLLDALLKNGIAVPSPCGGKATCKQCKVKVIEGSDLILEPDKATFSKKELKSGWRLSCQCRVKKDLKIEIPEHLLDVQKFQGTVISNQNVATFIKELVVQVEAPIEYQGGSYLQVHIPPYKTNTSDWKKTMDPNYFEDWEKFALFDREIDFSALYKETIRAYSLASFPDEKNRLKFTVRIASPPLIKGKMKQVPWGVGSSYLFSLKEGDPLSFSGPYGESFMKGENEDLFFLIGGAGASFARSHILSLFRMQKTHRRVSLWYGARSIKENIYEEEFLALSQEFPNFSYHLVLSEPTKEDLEKGWDQKDPLKTNFLFKAFESAALNKMKAPEEALYFVCGPPLHNRAVMKLLDDYGVERENVVLDDFGI